MRTYLVARMTICMLICLKFCEGHVSTGEDNILNGLLADTHSLPLILTCDPLYGYIRVGGLVCGGRALPQDVHKEAIKECDQQYKIQKKQRESGQTVETQCVVWFGNKISPKENDTICAVYQCLHDKPHGSPPSWTKTYWKGQVQTATQPTSGKNVDMSCPTTTAIITPIEDLLIDENKADTTRYPELAQQKIKQECFKQSVHDKKNGYTGNVKCGILNKTEGQLTIKYKCEIPDSAEVGHEPVKEIEKSSSQSSKPPETPDRRYSGVAVRREGFTFMKIFLKAAGITPTSEPQPKAEPEPEAEP